MIRTDLVIHLANGEMFVAGHRVSEIGSAACIDGRGKLHRDIHGSRTDRRGWQTVVYKRCGENDVASLAGPGGESCEITGDHIRCRNERRRALGAGPSNRPLISGKEKEFVLFNGTAKRSPKLIPFQRIPHRRKEIPAIEFVISHELKCRAVIVVGARFRYGVYGASRVEPILG